MRAFYRRWIIANGWAEAAGLGTTFVMGVYLGPRLDDAGGVVGVLVAAVAAIALGALLEGVVVGAAQESVLRRALPELRARAWVVATAIGAGLAWLIGMIPSTVMMLTAESTSSPPPEPAPLLQYALAAALGIVVGPILGGAQAVVLRRHVPGAWWWLWANALAWAVGLPVIFFGMDRVPWSGHPVVVAGSLYLVCGAAGLVVGAVHGRALLRLLGRREGWAGDKRVTRNIEPEEARDLLEEPPRACIVVAGDDGPEAWPAGFSFDDGRFRVGMPEAASPPGANEEVVVLVDEGIHFFDLRAVYIRGHIGSTDDDVWLAVEPDKVVAWDYGRLRERDDAS